MSRGKRPGRHPASIYYRRGRHRRAETVAQNGAASAMVESRISFSCSCGEPPLCSMSPSRI